MTTSPIPADEPIRVVFLGTPAFSVPTLQALQSEPRITVCAVVTPPDKPAGRGKKLTAPPVKETAQSLGLPVHQTASIRKDDALQATLSSLNPHFFVTAAFGQILSQAVLDIPSHGTVNVHASLLPAFRGANPIQHAILQGLPQTGITTMLTDIGVDTGDILLKRVVPITAEDTTASLTEKMAAAGGPLLVATLLQRADGSLASTPQDGAQATHAGKCTREDGWLDWTQPADALHNRIRAFQPWPATQTRLGEETLKIIRSTPPGAPAPASLPSGQPGAILGASANGLWVQTGSGPIEILTLQPPGKATMEARAWFNGIRSRLGQASLRFEPMTTGCGSAPVS
ncbi:MAG: methionyl-tRNA formyltransferase [Candidatus Melainabacteria bacterium]